MALRLIEFVVSEDNETRLENVLGDLQAIDFWQVPTGKCTILVRVLAEADQAEIIVSELEKRYAYKDKFRAILLEVKATSPPVQTPEDTSSEPFEKTESPKPSPERVACMELVTKMTDGVEISRNYILTVIMSVIVATVGLVRNNVAIIIGAMVIAPLLTPNMALSLAATLGDAHLARRALKANVLGILMAVVLAALVGLVLHADPAGSEIASRAEVGYSDIILALAAGGAGALAFTSGVSAALVGVMVAVAILPPLATAGL